MEQQDGVLTQFLQNNTAYVDQLKARSMGRLLFALSPRLRKLLAACDLPGTPEEKNAALARLIDACDDLALYKAHAWLAAARQDIRVLRDQWGKRLRLDNTNPHIRDYYAIAVIVKDEARYLREFVLFYLPPALS